MKRQDAQLIERIQKVFVLYLDDQESKNPRHRIRAITDGINGHLLDMIYQDKIDNEALAVFIMLIARVPEDRSDQEVLQRLQDIYDALSQIDTVNNLFDPEPIDEAKKQRELKEQELKKYEQDLKMAKENGWELPEKPEV